MAMLQSVGLAIILLSGTFGLSGVFHYLGFNRNVVTLPFLAVYLGPANSFFDVFHFVIYPVPILLWTFTGMFVGILATAFFEEKSFADEI